MITQDELEKFRTPFELKGFFIELMKKITDDPSAREKFRLNDGLFKYIKRELYPLIFFSIQNYNNDYLIKPVLGNQGYDAEVKANNGIIETIELTWAIDGKESIGIANEINEKGGSEVRTLLYDRKKLCKQRCLNNMRAKARKDYSKSVLVFVYDTDPTFSFNDFEDQKILRELLLEARLISFKAKKSFLFFLPEFRTLQVIQREPVTILIK